MLKKPVSCQKKPPRSNYRQLGLIGQGQFGQVFCGIHRQRGTLVALKDLHPQRFPTHKFLRELRILMTLRHPNIVSCQGMEHHEKGRYLVMDYCEGGTLRDLMDNQGRLNLILSLKLISDILAGLTHAHDRDIIHCDLKPENILLNLNKEGWTAQITDFGVARLLREEGGSSSGLGDTGSPAYMAPERYYGKYSPASDLYGVGVILFELLAGNRPFSGLPGEIMAAHISRPVVIPSVIPEVIRPIIKKGMEKLISRRYTSALEMLKDLEKASQILEKNISSFPRFSPPQLEISSQSLPVLKEEILNQSVLDLVTIKNCLYLGMKNEIRCQVYEQEILTSPLKQQFKLTLKTDFIKFKPSDQKCYSVIKNQSEDNYSLYSLSNHAPNQAVQMLSGKGNFTLNTIENKSVWCALIENSQGENEGYLKINNIQQKKSFKIKLKTPYPTDIIALDPNYGMIFCPQDQQETKVKIFTRKGKFIYSLTIPIQFNQLIPNLKIPYRYFTLDQQDQNLGFLIDFKPYRLLPISLGIKPDFIINIPQGFALFNNQGEGIILNEDGQQSNLFKLPVKPLVITSCGESYLLIVTEEENDIKLLLIDYKNMVINDEQE